MLIGYYLSIECVAFCPDLTLPVALRLYGKDLQKPSLR